MIKHIFLNKSCTITKNSEYNTGLNPISEICAGKKISRSLLSFDINCIKKLIDDKTIAETDKLTIKLKMKNCSSVMESKINEPFHTNVCTDKERASSFDIIAFKIEEDWDSGRGFDYEEDFLDGRHKYSTKNGCNWYQRKNGIKWETEGVCSNDYLAYEYFHKFPSKDCAIISRQHFDFGNEDLSIDITEHILDIIENDKKFYGIGLAFSPYFESTAENIQYIGFFNNNTNTFFNPYIELEYDCIIDDDRNRCYIGKDNKLYLFITENGFPKNLDKLPTCSVDGKELDVIQPTKGVYYALFSAKDKDMEPNTILYDKWSNLVLNGEIEDDVELDFELLPKDDFRKIGIYVKDKKDVVPSIYGIDDSEKIKVGDIREVNVILREKYSKYETLLADKIEYRLYVKEADRIIDVFEFQPLETRGDSHLFIINTNDLMPNDYYIDIRMLKGREQKYFREILKFTIEDNVTKYFI